MRNIGNTPAIGTRKRKLDLYATVAIGGLCAVLVAVPGRTQSVNPGVSFTARDYANPSATPSASMTTGTGTTDVQVLTPKAIIDWGVPAGTADYNFILPGTTTTFSSSGDFTVLNVVNVTSGAARAMQFNGNVVSRVNGTPGGNVWFYSPGGIIVGNNASFDVGSLLLTTLNPDPGNLPGANFADFNDGTPGSTIGFVTDGSSPLDVNGNNISQVQIGGTAAILAQNYVGIVAPRIVQAGTINAGGAVGLIAGEQANLDISADGGLFGISIPIGTKYDGAPNDPGNAAIVQTGTSTGSTAGTAPKRNMYYVAVPKNNAVTILLNGSLGYPANAAIEDSQGVVLLAGNNVAVGIDDDQADGYVYSAPSDNLKIGNIQIGDGANLTSRITAAGTRASVQTFSGVASFQNEAYLFGTESSALTVAAGTTVNAYGDLYLRSGLSTGANFNGGTTTATISGALRVASGGTLTIDAGSTGTSGSGASVQGGLATLTILDGTLEGLTPGTRGGQVTLFADAFGGGGTNTGGTASVLMSGGTARVAGLTINADGTGADNPFDTPGTGHGGFASLTVNAGTVTPTLDIGSNNLLIYARGTGGTAIDDNSFFDGSGDLLEAPGLAGAAGYGGTASFTVSAIGATVGQAGQEFNVTLGAGGTGGDGGVAAAQAGPYPDGGAGGLGQGGTTTLNITQGTSRLRSVTLNAGGSGGDGGDAGGSSLSFGSDAGNGGVGGDGLAGVARVILSDNAQFLGSSSGYSLTLSGTATGGNGGNSLTQFAGSGGGGIRNGIADGISLSVSGAALIERESILLTGAAQGGNGGVDQTVGGGGGGASASATLVTSLASSTPTLRTTGNLTLIGTAIGGSSTGSAIGGAATIDIAGGTLSVDGSGTLTTSATGGTGGASGGQQGNALGGNAAVYSTNLGTSLTFGMFAVSTGVDNSGFDSAIGGTAQGGAITVRALNQASIRSNSGYSLQSQAVGGDGTSTASSGVGGAITLEATNGSLLDAGVNAFSQLTSDGTGGGDSSATPGSFGGNGLGGNQTIAATNQSVINLGAGGLQLSAKGEGGSGDTGRNGTGGNVTISASGNQSFFVVGSGLSVTTYAQAGSGNVAGGSTGGSIVLRANDGAFQISGGGFSADAGSSAGNGGGITVETLGSAASSTTSFITGPTTLSNTAVFDDPITIRNAVTGTGVALQLGQLDVTSADGVVIETGSNPILAGDVDLRGLTIQISALLPASGGLISSGSFYASAQNSITVSAVNGNVPTITARSIELNKSNIDTRGSLLVANGDGTLGGPDGTIVIGSLTIAQLGNLQATQGIDVTATSGITINNASVTATAESDGSGAVNTSVGYVRLTAGDYTAPDDSRGIDSSAEITVAGAVSATGYISLTAPNSVNVVATGALLSDNGIDLDIGNDLIVDSGGIISGLINPLAGTGSSLNLFFNGSGSANSVINRGTITANSGALVITASAIDSIGGTFGGDSVTVDVTPTGFTGDDDGQLSTGCFIGSICVGTVTAQGDVNVGTSSLIPTTITLGGAITANNLFAAASNGITLGSGGIANIAITNDTYIDAGNGAITGSGIGTLSGATVRLLAFTDLIAPDYTFQTTVGDLSLDVENSIQVAGLVSAARLGSNPDGFANGLFQTGDFSAGLVSAAGGDVVVQAPNISIGNLFITDGFAIDLNALGGTLTLTNAATSSQGTAASALLQGNIIDVTALTTTGDATFIGSSSVSVADLLAGGVVTASADNVAITSSGSMNVASLTATGAILRSAGQLTVSGPLSASVLGLTSDTAGVTVTGTQSTGETVIRAAGDIALDTFTGTSIDFQTSAGDIFADSLTSTGATRLITPGTIALPVLSSTGAITASGGAVQIGGTALTFASLNTTGGDAQVTTSGDLVVTSGSATGSATFTSTAGRVTATSYSATQDSTLFGATIGNFTNLTGRNISITAQTGSFGGATLNASGTTFLQAPINVSVSALNSTGGVTASARGLQLIAPGAMIVTSATAGTGGMTLSAGGQLTVVSSTSAADSILESTGGGVAIGSATSTGPTTVLGAGEITATTLGGSRVRVQTTSGGIAAQSITTTSMVPSNPGTTTLSAPGAISVASLTSTGNVTATGGSLQIVSPGTLTFTNAAAANGGVNLTTQGALTVNAASATGDSSFIAGGLLTLPSFATGGDLVLAGNGIAAFTALSGRNVSLVATTGAISGPALTATGTTNLFTSGAINISALRSAGGVTASGSRITLTSPDTLTIANFTTAQGDATFRAANALAVDQGTSSGGLAMTSDTAGLTIGSVTATGAVTGAAAGPIVLTQVSGDTVALATTAGGISGQRLAATNTATLTAPGAISVTDDFRAASASVTGASVSIASTQDITFSTLTSTSGDVSIRTPGSVTVNGGNAAGAGSFIAGGALNLVSYTTGTDLILSAARLPTFGTLSARNISLTAMASDLIGGTLIASGTTNLSASGVLRITDLRSAGAATLSGATVDVGSTIALNVANAAAGDGGLRLRSTGALTVANATSTAGVDLASTGSNVTVGRITMTGTPAGITQQAVAGTSPLTIASAGTTTLNDAITGAGAATISGTGLVLNNLIDASGISLVSQTIVVGSQAAIGTLARTGTVAFTNSGTGRSFIGGTGSQSGYSLDANALSRIQASSVTLSLPRAASSSTATPDVVIGGFTLYGPGGTAPPGARQNLGTGLLSIATPGLVQVNGPVRLANLQSTGAGGLSIRAAGIDVVTPTGSILQTDASGAPAGTLDLNARTVRVASARALTDLATLATPAEREARLAQNDGNMSDVGWLSANTIRFSYPSGVAGGTGLATVYVQNSGGNGATARRGLTTGAGGVVIAGFPSSDLPEVFINGRLQTSPTTFVTGTAFLQSISQTGTAADILVNGCSPATGVCTGDTTPLTLLSQLAPPQDLIGVISNSTEEDDDEDTNEPGDPVPSRDPNAIIQFASPDPETGSQTTDDPVVGSGNESLWSGSSSAPGEGGGTSSFDTTIGVGNDAGSPDSGGNTSRSGAGGANSGSTPQQPGERASGLNTAPDGGLGVGNDAGSGGEQRSGVGTPNGAAGGANTPNALNSPANLQNGGGAVGVGGDTGGAGGASGGANSGGGTLPGATQGTTGGTTNGGTNNSRTNGAAAAEQTTGTGGDAGGTSGSGSGTTAPAGTPGAAGAATPGTTTNTNNNNRQTDPNAPR